MKKVFYKSLFTFTIILLSFALFTPPSFSFAAASHVVISQVQIAGDGTTNDFVEFFNPTNSPVDLNGMKLVKRTATGTADSSLKSFSTTTIIPPLGYYLWANSGWSPTVIPDATTSASIANDNGVALRNGALDMGTIIDSVAWGTASNVFVEGSVFPTNPPAGSSIQRKVDDSNGHGLDTNNNATDFELIPVSSPRNSSVVVSTPSATPTSTPVVTASPTATPTSSPVPTETPAETPVVTATPTLTPSPSASPAVPPTTIPTSSASPTIIPTSTPHEDRHDNHDRDRHGKEYVQEFHFGRNTIRCSVRYVFVHTRWFFGFYPEVQCSRR